MSIEVFGVGECLPVNKIRALSKVGEYVKFFLGIQHRQIPREPAIMVCVPKNVLELIV